MTKFLHWVRRTNAPSWVTSISVVYINLLLAHFNVLHLYCVVIYRVKAIFDKFVTIIIIISYKMFVLCRNAGGDCVGNGAVCWTVHTRSRSSLSNKVDKTLLRFHILMHISRSELTTNMLNMTHIFFTEMINLLQNEYLTWLDLI